MSGQYWHRHKNAQGQYINGPEAVQTKRHNMYWKLSLQPPLLSCPDCVLFRIQLRS